MTKSDPSNNAQKLEAASGRLAAGDFPAVITICQEILATGQHPRALHLLGLTQFRLGQPALAADLLNTAADLEKTNPDILVDLAMTLLVTGKMEPAILALRRAIILNPNHVAAYNNLAVALQHAGRTEEAIEPLRKVIELRPDTPAAPAALGYALQKIGRFKEAIEAYRLALSKNPDDIEILNNLGNTLRRCEYAEEALTIFLRILELCPNNPGATTKWRQLY